MKIKSLICLLLAVLMLATTLVGCTVDEVPEETTATTEPVDNGRELPKLMWDREYRVLGNAVGGTKQYATVSIEAEAPTDPISSDVYTRNLLLKEQYGIDVVFTGEDTPASTLNIEYFAQESNYELVFMQVHEVKSMMAAGCAAANLYDSEAFPYLYFEKACWNSYVNETLSINNKLYMTTGYVNLQEKMNTELIFYNREMLADMQSDINPVALVRSGDWTLEAMAKLRAEGTVTDGGTGEIMTYGLSCSNNRNFYHYVAASEVNIIGKDANDTPYFVIDNERTLDVIDEVLAMTHASDGGTFFAVKSGLIEESKSLFLDEKALMFDGELSFVDNLKSDAGFSYGFLPYPKYDSEQQSYYSNIHSYFSALFVIPAMAENKEFASFGLQAINEGSEEMNTNYIEINCKIKGSIDEEALEMLEIAIEKPIYDLGVVFGWGAIHTWIFVDYGQFPSLSVGGVNNFKTQYAAYEDQAVIELNRFLSYISE